MQVVIWRYLSSIGSRHRRAASIIIVAAVVDVDAFAVVISSSSPLCRRLCPLLPPLRRLPHLVLPRLPAFMSFQVSG